MTPIYFDTETCGLYGPTVLIQWAEGDGPVHLHEVWKAPAYETLKLIETIATNPGGCIGFNLAFDWFHLVQTYTTLLLLSDPSAYPEDCVEEYALKEREARDGPCLKPVTAFDLMLHARKGPYQSTMERGDIRIKKVPTAIAWLLAAELERRIPLADIYFARKKNKHEPKWKVYDLTDDAGDIIPDFKDVVLKFAPSSALKTLAADALGLKPDAILLFADIEPQIWPEELGYAPFALAIGKPGDWRGAWPTCINHHINHWGYHNLAREYAKKDVELTRSLYQHFGCPGMGDDDSVLACMVAACRWRGYSINAEGMAALKVKARERIKQVPTAPQYVKKYLQDVMDPTEIVAMKGSTKKVILEEMARDMQRSCEQCDESGRDPETYETCTKCGGKGSYRHPAAIRAEQILEARKALKEIEIYDKLLIAGRFHASFVVIGTLSSRMAGTDQLNAQGIKREAYVRQEFPLAWPGYTLCGGDFAGFEVVLAEACYNDPELRADLLTKRPCHKCCKKKDPALKSTGCEKCDNGVLNRGTPDETFCKSCLIYKPKPGCDDCWGTGLTDSKIHALFGQYVYPEMSYEEILADKEIYTRCKSAVFAMLYGGEGFTLKERLGVPIEVADAAYERFCRRYPGVGRARKRVIEMFCTLTQPGGIGSKVEWSDPADFIESMFGFRRYFSLENKIARALFELANKPPVTWKNIKVKVTRRDREQTAMGAVQSALYGATFALQSSNMRAAANHVIQSSGATITKMVQRRIWEIQPPGVSDWHVQPMNIHDEIMCPAKPELVPEVHRIVFDAVEELRPQVPLIKIDWKDTISSWAGK